MVEPESVEEVRAAVVQTAAGFTFAVAREPGGNRVLGILRLPPADQDMLDDTRSVQIQIDDGARLEPPRVGGGLKSTTFFLWDGVGEPVVGPLRDLMEARQRIRVQYSLAGGGYKLIELAATGAKERDRIGARRRRGGDARGARPRDWRGRRRSIAASPRPRPRIATAASSGWPDAPRRRLRTRCGAASPARRNSERSRRRPCARGAGSVVFLLTKFYFSLV